MDSVRALDSDGAAPIGGSKAHVQAARFGELRLQHAESCGLLDRGCAAADRRARRVGTIGAPSSFEARAMQEQLHALGYAHDQWLVRHELGSPETAGVRADGRGVTRCCLLLRHQRRRGRRLALPRAALARTEDARRRLCLPRAALAWPEEASVTLQMVIRALLELLTLRLHLAERAQHAPLALRFLPPLWLPLQKVARQQRAHRRHRHGWRPADHEDTHARRCHVTARAHRRDRPRPSTRVRGASGRRACFSALALGPGPSRGRRRIDDEQRGGRR